MLYDLICFSHLRWSFVFQRPQHLLRRFELAGHRVFYIEEAIYDATAEPYYDMQPDRETHVNVVVMHLPDDQRNLSVNYQRKLLHSLLADQHILDYVAWYYAPMAIKFTSDLRPLAIIYDCMDELSAFKFAPVELKQNEQALIEKADVVFTGGYSLYEAKKHLHSNIHPFPSSIDKLHFGQARRNCPDPEDQQYIPHPRLGFFGVIDERLDIDLLGRLADERSDYHLVIIGPVVKIDPASLPVRNNIHYLGGKSYQDLPSYLSGWDIAIMPFALNESTAFISPTKTPEFLAGGKPIISTPIKDVVNPYGTAGLVRIAASAEEFAQHADNLLKSGADAGWLKQVDAFLSDISWDNTWQKMVAQVHKILERKDINSPLKQSQHV